MNEQSAKLAHWLLAGNGALKNVAQLLTEAFGPAAVVAAAIDATTITAYPVNPADKPRGDAWTQTPDGWAHPLHSQLLPRSITAGHHVLAGITSRNELLIVNLAAAAYLGIEGTDPIPMMRSWLIQVLSKTPSAAVAVTDPALAIPGADRLTIVKQPADTPPATSILFSTQHTSSPPSTTPTPITVSSQAAGAANVVLCNEAVAGIYLANRYWPIWRRMELHEPQWAALKTALGKPAASEPAPTAAASQQPQKTATDPTPKETAEPELHAAKATSPASQTEPPAPAPPTLKPSESAETPAEQPTPPTTAQQPAQTAAKAPPPLLTANIPNPLPAQSIEADGINGHTPLLPGPPAREPAQLGLYVLGETYALGADIDTGEPVKHSAVTRQGVRKPVKALMALATSSGITTAEWEEKILQVTPQNRRQLRTQIRKMMGGKDPIRLDGRGLLVVDLFCDWKEFNRLAGHTPETASTENLTSAVQLIRGEPFADVPADDYSWRAVQLLKDELIDRCSTAAVELAQRQQAAGALEAAYQTARLGLRVYAQREDLWLVAANTVPDVDRPGLIWDLKRAIPVPTRPELRQLLTASRVS